MQAERLHIMMSEMYFVFIFLMFYDQFFCQNRGVILNLNDIKTICHSFGIDDSLHIIQSKGVYEFAIYIYYFNVCIQKLRINSDGFTCWIWVYFKGSS